MSQDSKGHCRLCFVKRDLPTQAAFKRLWVPHGDYSSGCGEIYLETRIWSGSPYQPGVPLLALRVLCSKPLHSLNVPPTCLPFLLRLLTQIYLLAILSAKSVLLSLNFKKKKSTFLYKGLPQTSLVAQCKNLSANAKDMGSIPSPERFHMPRSNKALVSTTGPSSHYY